MFCNLLWHLYNVWNYMHIFVQKQNALQSLRSEFSSAMNEKHITYSIKTFTQTWYNKQKQDLELMTEKKKFIFCFSSFNPEAHNIQSAPHVRCNKIQTGQRTDTREHKRGGKKIKKKGDSPFWFYSSRICLILCNKQRLKSTVREEGDRKVCDSFRWWRVNN